MHFTRFVFFFVTIGKRFKDTGLRDKAVIAEGLIEAVPEGRQYNRTVRPQKIYICRFIINILA